MGGVEDIMTETTKKYIMWNPANGARITCTEKYLLKWLSMGFVVEEVVEDNKPLVDWDN